MAPFPHPHPRGEILGQLASDSLASTHANSLEAAVIRRREGERRRTKASSREKPSPACRRANYFKRIRFALVKLKTISFSVIKQIIAHQECWASLSPSESLRLPLCRAPDGSNQGVGGDSRGGPLRKGRKRYGEVTVPLRNETALCPPRQPPPLTRERVQDVPLALTASAKGDSGGSSHLSPCLRAILEETPPLPSGTCSWCAEVGTGIEGPEKQRDMPEITQQIN